MHIDKNNIDELVFQNKQLRKSLLHLKHYFDQWLIGNKIPPLRFLAQKSRLELLEQLTKSDNQAILSNFFKEKVSIQTIDYHIARHHTVPLNELEQFLNAEMKGFSNNFSITRDDKHCYISLWR